MPRDAIASKSDTAEIVARVALMLNTNSSDVSNEIKYMWMDVDQMFNLCCGHSVNIEKFGSFIFYTRGIITMARKIESDIKRDLRYLTIFNSKQAPEKAKTVRKALNDHLTRLILLSYSIELYDKEVLSQYPKKFRVTDEKSYKAIISRVEKLLGVPLSKYPISINYPIQKVFVQSLRKKRVLRHVVIDNLRKARKHKANTVL